ncbi:MAG: hypothetical protein ACRECH_16610 [Nitrososphaerales archaeon]
MQQTTTVRLSRKTKARLEKVSSLTGLNLSKALDFAVDAAEKKIENYHGNLDSLLELKVASSGYRNTSKRVDKVVAKGSRVRK